jgi:hypothetical protein
MLPQPRLEDRAVPVAGVHTNKAKERRMFGSHDTESVQAVLTITKNVEMVVDLETVKIAVQEATDAVTIVDLEIAMIVDLEIAMIVDPGIAMIADPGIVTIADLGIATIAVLEAEMIVDQGVEIVKNVAPEVETVKNVGVEAGVAKTAKKVVVAVAIIPTGEPAHVLTSNNLLGKGMTIGVNVNLLSAKKRPQRKKPPMMAGPTLDIIANKYILCPFLN